MWGADLGELGEYLGFEGGDFGDGFNDEVHGGKVGHLGGGVEEGAGGGGVGLGDTVFGNVFLEEFV